MTTTASAPAPFNRLLLTGAADGLGKVRRESLRPYATIQRGADIAEMSPAAAMNTTLTVQTAPQSPTGLGYMRRSLCIRTDSGTAWRRQSMGHPPEVLPRTCLAKHAAQSSTCPLANRHAKG